MYKFYFRNKWYVTDFSAVNVNSILKKYIQYPIHSLKEILKNIKEFIKLFFSENSIREREFWNFLEDIEKSLNKNSFFFEKSKQFHFFRTVILTDYHISSPQCVRKKNDLLSAIVFIFLLHSWIYPSSVSLLLIYAKYQFERILRKSFIFTILLF